MELLIQEEQGQFVVDKTCSMLKYHYYWPKMTRDVDHLVKKFSTCHLAQSYVLLKVLYSPLSIPLGPR